MSRPISALCYLLLLSLRVGLVSAFVSSPRKNFATKAILHARTPTENELYWLEEFKAPSGDIVNPYKVLRIPREANKKQIKVAYRSLSKKLHPDATRFSKVLPRNCNDLDEVRDEWERVKLSYEILCDPRARHRYNRHDALAHPGEAVGRATLNLFGKGLLGLGSGMFTAGVLVFDKVNEQFETEEELTVI